MYTRRRFIRDTALLSGLASLPSLPGSGFAQEAEQTNSPSRLPAPVISKEALAVHRRAFVFDGHVHALDREFYFGGSIGTRKTDGYWDLPRAKEGGVDAFFMSIYIPEEYYPGRFETKQALRRIDHALEQLELNRDQVELALNANDIERIRAKGKMAAVLDIEGSYDLDGDLRVMHDMYRLGVRSAQLSAHNWNQHYADACCSTPQFNGITSYGREVIHEMNRLGMVINVSHASAEATLQAIDASSQPIAATHNGMRALVDIPRNMPDDVLKALAAKGGVFGFQIGNEFHSPTEYAYQTEHEKHTFFDTSSVADKVKGKTIYEIDKIVAPQFPRMGPWVPDSVRMTPDEWVGAVDRAIRLVGEDHVAIGTDIDGGPNLPRGMRDIRDLPMITQAMLKRGYSEARIDKFWGQNLLRLFRQVTEHTA
ncbi:MAG TPA: membrane dipeptidase [Acidobacteriaceae bacterium]|nr:membrane dipeptidase [Acidobacteriaceae bacterium]